MFNSQQITHLNLTNRVDQKFFFFFPLKRNFLKNKNFFCKNELIIIIDTSFIVIQDMAPIFKCLICRKDIERSKKTFWVKKGHLLCSSCLDNLDDDFKKN